MNKEIWKDIPGYDGLYRVSSTGRVISSKYRKTNKASILSQRLGGNGYYTIDLHLKSVKKTKEVHQLVAIAFLSHKPCGLLRVVNHIDEVKTNNNVENLEIVTHRENCSLKRDGFSSKFTGVNYHKRDKRWGANIKINGKQNYLGSFDSEIKASEAYQNRLSEHLKENQTNEQG
jgi:hypothetical protein